MIYGLIWLVDSQVNPSLWLTVIYRLVPYSVILCVWLHILHSVCVVNVLHSMCVVIRTVLLLLRPLSIFLLLSPPSPHQQLRKLVLEIIHRLPANDHLKGHVKVCVCVCVKAVYSTYMYPTDVCCFPTGSTCSHVLLVRGKYNDSITLDPMKSLSS